MTRTPKDDRRSDEQNSAATPPATDHAAIARLEQALDAEVKTSAGLRDSLDELRAKVDQIETSFDAAARGSHAPQQTAEHKIADQQKRLAALGNGREESMRLLADARAELVAREHRARRAAQAARPHRRHADGHDHARRGRDRGAEHPAARCRRSRSSWRVSSSIEEAGTRHDSGHLLAPVVGDDEESQEMIAPELVFPEEFGEERGRRAAPRFARARIARARVPGRRHADQIPDLQERDDDRPLRASRHSGQQRLHQPRARAARVDGGRRRSSRTSTARTASRSIRSSPTATRCSTAT